MAVETPKYEVLRDDGKFELRRYADYINATVRVSADDYRAATNVGFNSLANYIFGGNERGERIAMTAPVTSGHPASDEMDPDAPPVCSSRDATCANDEYIVTFTMPSAYSMESLPAPEDPRVELTAVPSHLMAAVRFGGYLNARTSADESEQLRAWVEAQGLEVIGAPVAAQYDAPWKPGFIRRNEILLPVRDS